MRATRRSIIATTLAALAGALLVGGLPTAQAAPTTYLVGRGISDVTGPAAENGMMGYSKFDQKTTGIHQRQRSRAFVTVDQATGKRVAYVNADLGMIFRAVQEGVLGKLKSRYGDLYTQQNVLLSATHTHAGPGGYSHNLAYNLAILGFQKQTFDATVDGIVESVVKAHDDLKPGTISIGRGELTNASVNRSRVAFEQNPESDKAHFPDAIDPSMTVLRFKQGAADVGAISWFATHNTSMTNLNTLISPDNKGYAAYQWEHDQKGVRYLDNRPGFVAAFPNTNAGDMSPNLNLRPGSGPTEDEFENTRIIGERQNTKANEIFDGPQTPVSGGIDYRMRFVDLSAVTVDGRYTTDGQSRRTCPGVVGASTLAGSIEDGPALPLFSEGMVNPIAALLEPLDVEVPQWVKDCQYPKATAVPTGLVEATPNVLPLQIVKLGQLHLIAVPAEVTIVSGLRMRRTVAAELGVPLENVLIQGYANDFSQYVTTPEEYDKQQYEGGSTLFGRDTLPAYQQEFAKLAQSLRSGSALPPGATPTKPLLAELNLQTGVVFDDKGLFQSFGQVLTEPAAAYERGQTVTTKFVTGHPKNNLRRNGTYLEVQRETAGQWKRIADDGDWSTRYHWARVGLANSEATITWTIPPDVPPGRYRIVHHGDWKSGWTGAITPFTGTSRTFTVN
ncbi:neutral ceramidase [Actinokineospora alba]|uniref:Neutral ceramidase n=1 Tax=Actinokineospora alba TaxID=504798 RepID=A0A1H0LMN2_9PSEU|nr:neutral/alkaline ceramidase [Actinokineospora alba]TDP67381.1 neutral ceramidase [Actinokineospora alba]SDI98303.1 neutral ceramidase [Actinokineospora alba]SDO69404.1 neutral ceramidase [Actinokineospora alba]